MGKVDYMVVGAFCIDGVKNDKGKEMLSQFGGNAAYGSMGARIWAKGRVGAVARVGNDFPMHWVDEIEASGVDISGVRHIDKKHTLCGGFVYAEDGSRRGDVSIDEFESGTEDKSGEFVASSEELWDQAQKDFGARAEDIPEVYNDVIGVHLAPRYYENQLGCIKYFKDLGSKAKIILDPGDWYLSPDNMENVAKLFSGADVVLPSEVEARCLFGDMDLHEAAKRIADMGPSVVVVKVGPKGSLLYERDKDRFTEIGVYKTDAQDPTGAGDSFCGGFIVGLTETNDPIQAALYGTTSASFIVEGFGVGHTANVTREMAEERMARIKETL